MLILVYFRCLIPIFLCNISHYLKRDKGRELDASDRKHFHDDPAAGRLLGSTTCGLLLYAFSVFIRPQAQFGWSVPMLRWPTRLSALFRPHDLPAGHLSDKIRFEKSRACGRIIMAFGFFMVSTITPPDPAVIAAGR